MISWGCLISRLKARQARLLLVAVVNERRQEVCITTMTRDGDTVTQMCQNLVLITGRTLIEIRARAHTHTHTQGEIG